MSASTLVDGAEYFVSEKGSDTNAGSQAQPWRTIQKAANTAVAGDTVIVRGGLYNERVVFSRSGSAGSGPVVFRNFAGETPIVDGAGISVNGEGLFEIYAKSYLTIDGFELRNLKTADKNKVPIGISVSGTCSNISILNNEIHEIETNYTGVNGGDAHGIAVYGDTNGGVVDLRIQGNKLYNLKLGSSEAMVLNGNVSNFEVRENVIHDCNNIGIDFIGFEGVGPSTGNDQARNGICVDNLVYNIDSQGNPAYGTDQSAGGIYVDGGKDIVIERNTVHHCNIGIELASEHAGKATSGVTLRNNLIYQNHIGGIFIGGYDSNRGSTENCLISNNTLYQNDSNQDGNGELYLQFDTRNNVVKNNIFYTNSQNLCIANPWTQNTGNTVDYNLFFCPGTPEFQWENVYYTGLANYRTGSGNDAQSLFSNPQFANSAEKDFHISASSPASNAGDPGFSAGIGETDFEGDPRIGDTRIDIGFDEFLIGPYLPPPTDLTSLSTPPDRIVLSWIDNSSDETEFRIERSESGGAFSQIAIVAPNLTSYDDFSVQNGVSYSYRVRAVNAEVLSEFSNLSSSAGPSAFEDSEGFYSAFFEPASPDSNGVFGLLTFTAKTNSSFSGYITLGALKYRLVGAFDNTGNAAVTIPRKNDSELTVTLNVDLEDPNRSVSGQVTDGSSTAAVVGEIATSTSNYLKAGIYTTILKGDPNLEMPEGFGQGIVTVNAKGTATISVILPDATRLTSSGRVSEGHKISFFRVLATKPALGYIGGTLEISDNGTDDLHGQLTWIKPANPRNRFYPEGFGGTLTAFGSKYVKPTTGQRVLNLGPIEGNLLASFSPSDLTPAPGDITVTLTDRNRFSFVGRDGFTSVVNISNGRFAGTFSDYTAGRRKNRTFQGVFLQRQNIGLGNYFGISESGAVHFTPVSTSAISLSSNEESLATVSNEFIYTITADNGAVNWGYSGNLPAGVTYDGGNHRFIGTPTVPGIYWITIWAEDEAGRRSTKTLRITVNSLFTATSGSYFGLALETPATHQTSAEVRIHLGKSGVYSATVTLAGVGYRVRGVFDPVNGGAQKVIVRKNLSDLLFTLRMDDTGIGTTISGTLSTVDPSPPIPVNASFIAKVNPFSKTNRLLETGGYTLALPAVDGPGLPQSHGYGSASISYAGIVKATMILGDGSRVTTATALSGDDPKDFPIYKALGKKRQASLFGLVTLDSTQLAADLSGALIWEDTDENGFSDTVSLVASKFRRPLKGERVVEFADIIENGSISFGNAGITPPPGDIVFTLPTTNKITSTTSGFRLGISTASGAFSGSLPTAVGTKTFRGVVLQKSGSGYGQYIGADGIRDTVEIQATE